jgi:predicted nuclease of restriction endonuclease-like RecB superfamily
VDQRLADGLRKLVEDRCSFDTGGVREPADLRKRLFERAAAARRELAEGVAFDRAGLVAELAVAEGLSEADLERALFADLRGAELLGAVASVAPARLVEDYERAQAQAVLLRAVAVRVVVRCRGAAAYRVLFRKLKFLRLLHTVRAGEDGRYEIEVEGPFSMFESVTAYGLRLAMLLPLLEECDEYALEADVRWGKRREALVFRLRGGAGDARGRRGGKPELPEELSALVRGLGELETPWRVREAPAILELPGVGLCVPDLELTHEGTGEVVYLEVLGYWSRDAVWKRVTLVEQGLATKILFAVSDKLRVSEAALGDELPGALYVYKRVMSARQVIARVEALAQRPG